MPKNGKASGIPDAVRHRAVTTTHARGARPRINNSNRKAKQDGKVE